MSIKIILILTISVVLLTSCRQTNEDLFNKAYSLSKQRQYDSAIEIYSEIIKRNDKLQQAYYNRGLAYVATNNYKKSFDDFNKIIELKTYGSLIVTLNQDLASEEAKEEVPYNDALYERAQVKFYMDSVKSSFRDFQNLIDNNYTEKSNCFLWEGVLWIKSGKSDSACKCFQVAKDIAQTENDKAQADSMIETYCNQH